MVKPFLKWPTKINDLPNLEILLLALLHYKLGSLLFVFRQHLSVYACKFDAYSAHNKDVAVNK